MEVLAWEEEAHPPCLGEEEEEANPLEEVGVLLLEEEGAVERDSVVVVERPTFYLDSME